jgi:hypothetical protein
VEHLQTSQLLSKNYEEGLRTDLGLEGISYRSNIAKVNSVWDGFVLKIDHYSMLVLYLIITYSLLKNRHRESNIFVRAKQFEEVAFFESR